MSSLTIHLEIGHEASLRTKITPEGFTHDWEVYVRGVNNADIHQYVEKVVFHLHETFIKPKRVVKEPPYSLKTSGYAGFNLPIEIYLRNNQEPRKIKFNYDLQLQPNGPTLYKVQKEKYVFNSPTDEFRNKLLKGGAVVGTLHDTSDTRSNIDEKNQMTSKPKLSTSSLDVLKKPKYRPDMNRDSFHNLFGTPITKTNKPELVKPKEQSQSKSQPSVKPEKEKSKTKNPYKDKEKSKSSNDSKSKEERKSKEKPKEHDRSREKKREKSRDRSATPKEKERKEEKKSKKEKREHKENKHREREKGGDHKESHKSRDVKPSKENHVVKEMKESSPFPQQKTDKKDKLKEDEKQQQQQQQRVEEKSKHKYKKKDKERKEKKEEKSHKEKKPLIKENGKELPPDKSSLFDSPKSEEPKKPTNNALVEESSSSSRNSSRDPSPIPEPIEMPTKKVHDNNVELKKIKDEMREKKKEKRDKKRDKKLEKEHEKKRKRKLDSDVDVPALPPPPPEKKERDDDFVNNNSDDERKVSSSEDATSLVPPKIENEDYMGMLRNLQHKIMALKDNNDLQKVVQLIAETGRYEVSQHTFDFDLCLLEPSTVRQLQDFFSTIP